MPDISLLVDIHASPTVVFDTVSTASGIRKWWSPSVTEDQTIDHSLIVQFDDRWKLELRKLQETPDESVAFRIIQHDSDEWVGTELHFDLEPQDGWTILRFDHRGWANQTDFFRFCSTKWCVFLLSIKQVAETGEGTPYPNETKIGRHD